MEAALPGTRREGPGGAPDPRGHAETDRPADESAVEVDHRPRPAAVPVRLRTVDTQDRRRSDPAEVRRRADPAGNREAAAPTRVVPAASDLLRRNWASGPS